MYLGYIVGDIHPLLETISSSTIENRDKPVLIVGMGRALELFPDEVDVSKKKIKDNIYYIFSKSESEKYEESLNNFLQNCYLETISKYEVEKRYLELEDIILFKNVFVYETPLFLTITSGVKIYYIDKAIYNFFNNRQLDTVKIISRLKKENPDANFYSWSNDFYIQAYLKTINFYISLNDFKLLHFFDDNFDLYLGASCLEWLKKIKTLGISEKTLNVWNDAYKVEEKLSNVKVKLSEKKIDELQQLDFYKNSLQYIQDNYIQPKYNGTDKITGRIYTQKNFSLNLQTLPEKDKDLVIAEHGCLLIEYDYSYFEYALLYQIVGLGYTEDPHLKLAEEVFKDKNYRSVAKTINYGILYGQAIENSIKNFKNQFPNLKFNEEILTHKLLKFIQPYEGVKQQLKEEYNKTFTITNYFGRNIYPEKESYVFLNNYIQSTAADFLNKKILKIDKYLKKYPSVNKILLQKFDSILFNFNTSTINDTTLMEDVISILESPEDGLIAKGKFTYGKNWKNME